MRDRVGARPNHKEAEMWSMTIDAAAIWLTDAILGEDGPDLEQTLKAIAANIGVLHIAYAPLCSQKSEDANLLSAICTYPVAWQARYFKKQYARIDPVIAHGSEAVLSFDWDELPKDDLATQAFFDDAADHDVGRNGLSIPVRNRKGVRSLVSFTSNHSKDAWAEYKSRNMVKLQPMAVLIDSAAGTNFKLTPEPVELSKREEDCLIWAARGKTYHDIAGLLNLSFASVKGYLDTARHKLSCSRRHCDWSHTGESPETALLTRAQWRSGVRAVFVDFKPRMGDRREA
jgi:DNA-binding CsgD family transcriptional regulator